MSFTTIGEECRIRNPAGASKDIVAADAPALSELFDDPANHGGEDLLFYTPATAHYTEVREFWNIFGDDTDILAVLRPLTEGAVQAAIRHLVQHKIPLSIRSGSRGAFGQGRADTGGVVIDMRAMDRVSVRDPTDRGIPHTVAAVGGGITSGALGRSLYSRNLITPTGWSGGVGFTGWICGGGYGFLSAKHGLGVDNLLGARVVTASGEVVDTDDERHKELLWALRGAGNGTLGIITELRVKAFPAPNFLAGVLGFPLTEAKDILRRFRKTVESTEGGLPDAINGETQIVNPSGLQPLLTFLFAWAVDSTNTIEEGRRWQQTMKAMGTLVMDTVEEVPLHEFHEWRSTKAPPSNYHIRTRSTRGAYLNDAAAEVLIRHPPPNQLSTVIIHNARGKAIEPNTEICFVLREEHNTFAIVGGSPAGEDADGMGMQSVIKWADELWEDLDSTGLVIKGSYGSFENPDHIEVEHCYGEEAVERLKSVKRRYDPSNVFDKGYPRLDL